MVEQNPYKIKNIVIVGGGTAGWLSASYLNRALNKFDHNSCKITLIESSDISTIGVGEATIPHIINTFRFLGISEFDWMMNCNATFKLGIKFVNWSGLPGKEVFWHPFGELSFISRESLQIPISHYWLKKNF